MVRAVDGSTSPFICRDRRYPHLLSLPLGSLSLVISCFLLSTVSRSKWSCMEYEEAVGGRNAWDITGVYYSSLGSGEEKRGALEKAMYRHS